MSESNCLNLIKKCNEKLAIIGESLFAISQIEKEDEKENAVNQLSKTISELSQSRRELSDNYFQIVDSDERVSVKAHLKYYADMISELTGILRLYDAKIDIYESMIKTYKLIEGKDSLISSHYMDLAQNELNIIKDENFKNLLEGIMDYKLFEREQRELEEKEKRENEHKECENQDIENEDKEPENSEID